MSSSLAEGKPPTVKLCAANRQVSPDRPDTRSVGGKVQGCLLNQNRREMNQESVCFACCLFPSVGEICNYFVTIYAEMQVIFLFIFFFREKG